jgi:hypothetical protein
MRNNDKIITREDILDYFEVKHMKKPVKPSTVAELQVQRLDRRVDIKDLVKVVSPQDIEAGAFVQIVDDSNDEYVDIGSYIELIIPQRKLSDSEYMALLKQYEQDLKVWKDQRKAELKRQIDELDKE